MKERVSNQRVALYPGSFDPITLGHLDILERAMAIFDRVVVSVLRNPDKQPLFSVEERLELIREATRSLEGEVEVDAFDGLTVEHAKRVGAIAIVRGLRALSDFETEFQMALMNRRLRPEIETVFLMANEAYSFISSRLVKEVYGLGGNISGLVPPSVEARMHRRLSKTKHKGA